MIGSEGGPGGKGAFLRRWKTFRATQVSRRATATEKLGASDIAEGNVEGELEETFAR